MAEILLASESARSRAPQLSNTTLLNFMTERQPPEAKGQAPLFGSPGIKAFATAGNSPCRGSHNYQGSAFFVQGTELYAVRANGSAFLQPGNIPGTGPVSMADNGQQMCIVNGVHGWIYDSTAGLVQITDTAFSPARTVSFMDGYFLFDHRDTNQWFISDLYNGFVYSGLDFASAEAQSGKVVAVWENLQLVYVFTTSHIELWYDAGTASFPFQRYQGAVIPYGCEAPHSIVRQDGALFFLGADKVFYRLQANVVIRISTHPIEDILAKDPDLSRAETFTLTIQGHKLVFLTLPGSNLTLCWDISTGRWHDRDSVDDAFVSLGRYRGRNALQVYGKTLMGDAFDGRIGELDWSTYTEYGLPMMGLIDTVNQHYDRRRVFCSRFELDMEFGVGNTVEPGADPQVMLRKSTDGGKTFGNHQPWRAMGKQGEYDGIRLRWLRQGQARQMMWRLVYTDPVQRVIIAAHGDVAPGLS